MYLTEQYERLLEIEALGIHHLRELHDKYGKIKHAEKTELSDQDNVSAAEVSDSDDASVL